MTTAVYDIGDLRRLSANFKVNGADTDPTTVTFRIREPDGTETPYVYLTNAQLVRLGSGNFYVDWPIAKSGRHAWEFIGTGAAQAREAGEFWAKRKDVGA